MNLMENVRRNLAYYQDLKATESLYRALRHASKAELTDKEKEKFNELASFVHTRIVYDSTLGQNIFLILGVIFVVETLFFGGVLLFDHFFPVLNDVSDLMITLCLLAYSLVIMIPVVFLTIRPEGLMYQVAVRRAERREQWLYGFYQNTSTEAASESAPPRV